MGDNRTTPYRAALVVTGLGALLHGYEQLTVARAPSLGWFAWAMLPYAVSLFIWARAKTATPALAGVIAALAFDVYVHYSVFVHPQSHTDGLVMTFAPLWSSLLFSPAAMLGTWLLIRRA